MQMNHLERRANILQILAQSEGCVPAAALAAHFGVTRQIIVSDIAILRANGKKILATSRGYSLSQTPDSGLLESVACCHRIDQIRDEFYAVVDNGGSVLSVVVEHPLYGQISADLNIRSRYDADEFIAKAEQANANQLCDLTDGFHFHMIRVPDKAAFQRITDALNRLGILVPAGEKN
jgi:transcriptional regulator of NAD metabolism